MARFVTLTDADASGGDVVVNLDNVAWMTRVDEGTAIVFAVAPNPQLPSNELLVVVTVRETLEEIREILQGVGDKASNLWPL